MPNEVTLDSSAIAAAFFKDTFSERVDAALRRFDRFHTVDLAYAELANVAWKRVVHFQEDPGLTSRALEAATDFIRNACQVGESSSLLGPTFDIGIKHKITAYDGLFVALARETNTKLLTADERLHAKLQLSGELAGLAILP